MRVDGTMLPDAGESHPDIIARLERLRRKAAVKMGIAEDEEGVPEAAPKIIMVSPPKNYKTLAGELFDEGRSDLIVRSLTGLGFHRALQITAGLATAAAAKIEGTVANMNVCKNFVDKDGITLGHPSGTLLVTAEFDEDGVVREATVFRTARRLMEGNVFWR